MQRTANLMSFFLRIFGSVVAVTRRTLTCDELESLGNMKQTVIDQGASSLVLSAVLNSLLYIPSKLTWNILFPKSKEIEATPPATDEVKFNSRILVIVHIHYEPYLNILFSHARRNRDLFQDKCMILTSLNSAEKAINSFNSQTGLNLKFKQVSGVGRNFSAMTEAFSPLPTWATHVLHLHSKISPSMHGPLAYSWANGLWEDLTIIGRSLPAIERNLESRVNLAYPEARIKIGFLSRTWWGLEFQKKKLKLPRVIKLSRGFVDFPAGGMFICSAKSFESLVTSAKTRFREGQTGSGAFSLEHAIERSLYFFGTQKGDVILVRKRNGNYIVRKARFRLEVGW